MELSRIIHPVGQGGFYSEKLTDGNEEVSVIYDCGGNNQKTMESYLENYYPGKIDKNIDAVFISHMHEDHINGLEYLLTHFNVRYLFLPQLNEGEKLEAFLFNYFRNTKSIGNSLLLELYGQNNDNYYLNTNTRIIIVPRNEESEFSVDVEIKEDKDINIQQDNLYSLDIGTKIHFNSKWVYIPFNPPIKSKLIKEKGHFDVFFKKSFNLKTVSIRDLPSIIRKVGVDRCKAVYTDYFGFNHNAYSMTLFSGATRPVLHSFIINKILHCKQCHPYCDCFGPHCPHCDCFDPVTFSPNCLYMGDFDTKKHVVNLKNFYKRFWDTIATMQVPHHGSRYNFDSRLYDSRRMKGYISVGENNIFHHPNIDTLIGMKRVGCEPILVTDNLSTIHIFHAKDER